MQKMPCVAFTADLLGEFPHTVFLRFHLLILAKLKRKKRYQVQMSCYKPAGGEKTP